MITSLNLATDVCSVVRDNRTVHVCQTNATLSKRCLRCFCVFSTQCVLEVVYLWYVSLEMLCARFRFKL